MFEFLIAIVFICCPTAFQLLGLTTTAYVAFIITMVFGAIFFGYFLVYYINSRRDEWVTGMDRAIFLGINTLFCIGLGVFLAIKMGIV